MNVAHPAAVFWAEDFCPYCGRPVPPAGLADDPAHRRCGQASVHEPPRYCARCGRRMVVQVKPVGWTARCVQHGELSG